MSPYPLVCPFCQSRRGVKPLSADGARGNMVRLECRRCQKAWSEQMSLDVLERHRAARAPGSAALLGTVLWQIKAVGAQLIQCVLKRRESVKYALHVLKGRDRKAAMLEHDYPNRVSAIAASIQIYRKFKDNGFHNTTRPAP